MNFDDKTEAQATLKEMMNEMLRSNDMLAEDWIVVE